MQDQSHLQMHFGYSYQSEIRCIIITEVKNKLQDHKSYIDNSNIKHELVSINRK